MGTVVLVLVCQKPVVDAVICTQLTQQERAYVAFIYDLVPWVQAAEGHATTAEHANGNGESTTTEPQSEVVEALAKSFECRLIPAEPTSPADVLMSTSG